MSDLLFTTANRDPADLTAALSLIHSDTRPAAREFRGDWGALSILENHYRGFQPHETESYVCAVVGGPLLSFRENDFLDEENSSTGTAAILDRWLEGEMTWDEDLSGPFTAFFVDKEDGAVTFVTDLLMFVPVYTCRKENGEFVIGTHVDSVARAAGVEDEIDPVSIADFVLNGVVTFPHTCYPQVGQASAGTIHSLTSGSAAGELGEQIYWIPEEKTSWGSIAEAAQALREGLLEEVDTVTRGADRVAAFVSAGEDSRSILGALPDGVACDGFTYLYANPRDRRITEQVTKIFGVNHTVDDQGYHYYLEILSQAAALVGSGHQYSHAHALGFYRKWGLPDYHAVLGGYHSDSLFKGIFSRKRKARGLLGWLPEFPRSGETHTRRQRSEFFREDVLDEIQNRKREQMARVQEIRPKTAHEWFGIWPATMQQNIPNFLATRRLFRSYEPFMGRVPIKVGAGTPLTWKLNRRLFNRAMRPLLAPTRRIGHSEGHFPYLPFWCNMPFVLLDKLRKYGTKFYHGLTCAITGRETPWQRRRASKTDPEWQRAFEALEDSYDVISEVIANREAKKKFSSRQTRNLLQVLDWIERNRRDESSGP